MGMRIPSGSPAPATSLTSVAQWRQRTQPAEVLALVNSAAPPSTPAGTPSGNLGRNVNLTA